MRVRQIGQQDRVQIGVISFGQDKCPAAIAEYKKGVRRWHIL